MTGKRFVAGTDDEGERLDVALARWLGEPRSRAAARITRGEVTVDGRTALKSLRLAGGETVLVIPPVETAARPATVSPPPVRFEDDHLLVVAKPPGLVVHPGVGRSTGTLVQALTEAGYSLAEAGGQVRPGVVHRLDRDTSGLLILAKTDPAYAGLVAALKRRDVERGYLALVEGVPAPAGRVEAPIGRHPTRRTRFAAVAGGKPAVTHWTMRAQGRAPGTGDDAGVPVALVACRLETGRTHQVRVHLSHAGHPVVGDRSYGARRDLAEALGLARPFLHAAQLAFTHPVTGQRVELQEPLPDDLATAADLAGIPAVARGG